MKKALSLILALVVCLSLCACGGGNDSTETTQAPTPEKAIVGEWKSLDGAITTFCEDGTGKAPNGYDFSWKYDKDTGWYMMSLNGMTFSTEISTENGIRFFVIEGIEYYHTDDYEKAVETNKPTESTDNTDTENDSTESTENPWANHPHLTYIYGKWELIKKDSYEQNETIPCSVVTINEDGTCVVDGVSGTWKISIYETREDFLKIQIFIDGEHCYTSAYYDNLCSIAVWSADYLSGSVDPSWKHSE